MYIDVQPTHSVAPLTAQSDGQANFTVTITLLSDPKAPAQLVATVTDAEGWAISPTTYQWRVTMGGTYLFNFSVTVPNTEEADATDSVDVEVAYRTGAVTVASAGQTVTASAGEFRAGAVRRISAGEPMGVGKTYIIQYEALNTGNTGAVFVFSWADSDLNSRLKANFELPQSLSLGPFSNATAAFRVTPQATTPDGTFQVPARMVVTDRSGTAYETVNFTVEMEFVNLPLYPGVLPRFDLTRAWALTAWVLLVLSLWAACQLGLAVLGMRKLDPAEGARYPRALKARLRSSLVGRDAAGLWHRRRRHPRSEQAGGPRRRAARALESSEKD